jgi:anhydro-N-acetylmuramic acid kinase
MVDSSVFAGVLSGTSLDGVTAAVARFTESQGVYDVDLLACETVPYTEDVRERIRAALTSGPASEYNALNFALGEAFAHAVTMAVNAAGVARTDIGAIGAHGQTIWHEPPRGTWQLGEGAVIVERLGIPVIEGFRTRDVAAGGQGAPLVPIADALLFGHRERPRALQNIGGIANVTVVQRRGDTAGVRAFDTGPGIAVIDALMLLLTGRRLDVHGEFARRGQPVSGVIPALLAHEYFRREPPKSTGRELFGDSYARAVLDACRREDERCSDADVIATATELTARSIADAYARFVPEAIGDIVVSGGGVRNLFLIERLRALVPATPIVLFDEVFFSAEAKEAVLFAFLALLHVRARPGNVPGATGARGPRILGKYIPA